MFPKERPSHPSLERMPIVLMLKVHKHHLLLGPSPSMHVTCHCHLMLTTENHAQILQTSSIHGQCMYVCEYAETHTHQACTQSTQKSLLYLTLKSNHYHPLISYRKGKKYLMEKASSFSFIIPEPHLQLPVI